MLDVINSAVLALKCHYYAFSNIKFHAVCHVAVCEHGCIINIVCVCVCMRLCVCVCVCVCVYVDAGLLLKQGNAIKI